MTIKCKCCGKEFKGYANNGKFHKYCSRECYNKCNIDKESPGWKGGKVKKTCNWCGIVFYVYPNIVRKGYGMYCSKRCANSRKHKKNKKIKRVCKNCKTISFVYPSVVKKDKGHFCSLHCSSLWNIKNTKKKDTSIELAVEKVLIKWEIPYEKQKIIDGIACVDFYLPETKTIIQCDGSYWHSIKKVKNRDINQDIALTFHGYRVFRLTEKEIKASAEECLSSITVKEFKNDTGN